MIKMEYNGKEFEVDEKGIEAFKQVCFDYFGEEVFYGYIDNFIKNSTPIIRGTPRAKLVLLNGEEISIQAGKHYCCAPREDGLEHYDEYEIAAQGDFMSRNPELCSEPIRTITHNEDFDIDEPYFDPNEWYIGENIPIEEIESSIRYVDSNETETNLLNRAFEQLVELGRENAFKIFSQIVREAEETKGLAPIRARGTLQRLKTAYDNYFEIISKKEQRTGTETQEKEEGKEMKEKDIDMSILTGMKRLCVVRDNWNKENIEELMDEILDVEALTQYSLSQENADMFYELRRKIESWQTKLSLIGSSQEEHEMIESDAQDIYKSLCELVSKLERDTHGRYSEAMLQNLESAKQQDLKNTDYMLNLHNSEEFGPQYIIDNFSEDEVIDYLVELSKREHDEKDLKGKGYDYYSLVDDIIAVSQRIIKIKDRQKALSLARLLVSNSHVCGEGKFDRLLDKKFLDDKEFIVELVGILENEENYMDSEQGFMSKCVILQSVGRKLSADKEFLSRVMSPMSLEVYDWADLDIEEDIEFEGQYIDALEQADRMGLEVPGDAYEDYNINPENEKYIQSQIDGIKKQRKEELEKLKSEIELEKLKRESDELDSQIVAASEQVAIIEAEKGKGEK